MTQATAAGRRLLPLFTPETRHGSRSYLTCHYRCGNACDQPVPNQTGHGHVQDEIARVVARRSVLGGAALGAGALLVGTLSEPAAAAETTPRVGAAARTQPDLGLTTFRPVQPNKRDAVSVAEGFRSDVLIRWGDPVVPGAPRFDVHHQTPEAARKQFGYNNDYVGVVPTADPDRALLVVNHEYTDEQLMHPAGSNDEDTIKRIAIASHGLSVVGIRKGRAPGSWVRTAPRLSPQNRRIHGDTVFVVSGPAAGDPRLRTTADPTGTRVKGTFGNCAGGLTPWGTVLSGEENFNGYFDASGAIDPAYSTSFARYGLSGSGRGWSSVDRRFDLSQEPHEAYRFGWIVEVDPRQPKSAPRKLSMLGRFKHEGANVAIARNRKAVVYMGDDERGDYLYKFVSRDRFDPRRGSAALRHNKTLLDHGTLFVAKLSGDGTEDGQYDGTGTWIPLTSDRESYVAGMSVADVLIDTRLAADKVAPTKMDRPEDVEPNPVNGRVYAALTNNSNRGTKFPVDEPNPLASSMVRDSIGSPLRSASGNRNGYVLELVPAEGNHAARTFTWNLMLVCGDPEAPETYFAGFDKSQVSPISCPDNVAFDGDGNLWISTDGNVLGSNDGIFKVPTAGPDRGKVQQFLTVPRGAEACGPLISRDDRTLFFAVQHPGEVDGATFEQPASTWPHSDDFPRPSVCTAYRLS